MKEFKKNNVGECFSGLMTQNEAIKFWMEPKSFVIDSYGPKVRYAAIQFLLFDRNQSGQERVFSGFKRNAASARPRLYHETPMYEEMLRKFRLNKGIFDNISKTGNSSEPTEERRFRNRVSS